MRSQENWRHSGATNGAERLMNLQSNDSQLTGFLRKNGRWGFRNYILVLPLHNALNQLADQVRVHHPATAIITSVAHDWSGEVDSDLFWLRD